MPVLTLGPPDQAGRTSGSTYREEGMMMANEDVMGAARWASVSIPQGSTIESATMTMTRMGSSYPSSLVVLLHDNIPDLTDLGWTTASGTTPKPWSNTMVMTSEIQPLINRSGWVEGNALAIRMTSTAPTYAMAGATITSLVIDWTPPWNAGPDQSVEPFSTVTLTGTPAGGTWTQVSGEPVSLGGSGETRTFTAPAKMTPHTLVFAYGTDEMTVIVDAAKHAIIGSGGELIPTRMQVL